MARVVLLELNEISFQLLRRYAAGGHLPNLQRLFEEHGFARTDSETEHARVNPWIQWVTAHTGLEYDEHGVFRMGDVVNTDLPHIWDRLENQGCTVAAMAPFNALNRCRNPVFFVPDPWTETRFVGPWDVRLAHEALDQVANDYASGRITLTSLVKLGIVALVNMQWKHLPSYLRDTCNHLRGRRWARALVCDRLLTDIFIRHWRRNKPDYASLCLNGGAHLQHHYMLNSPFYRGPRENPEWHVAKGQDPVLEAYQLYDEIVGDLLKLRGEGLRLLIATGLSQAFHERHSLYYRMDRHEEVLNALGIPFRRIHPLMTEDFVVEYASETEARQAQHLFEQTVADRDDIFYVDNADVPVRRTITSDRVFYVDNRGTDLYVQLKPTATELPRDLTLRCKGRQLENFGHYVSFAQLKNGHHIGTGYFIDTGLPKGGLPLRFRLKTLPDLIEAVVLCGEYDAAKLQAAA